MSEGVAQAKGTAVPGEEGNVFIFSHSGSDFYQADRFNAVFYLLDKLGKGDQIDLSALVNTNNINQWINQHVSYLRNGDAVISIDHDHSITVQHAGHLFASDFIVSSGPHRA